MNIENPSNPSPPRQRPSAVAQSSGFPRSPARALSLCSSKAEGESHDPITVAIGQGKPRHPSDVKMGTAALRTSANPLVDGPLANRFTAFNKIREEASSTHDASICCHAVLSCFSMVKVNPEKQDSTAWQQIDASWVEDA